MMSSLALRASHGIRRALSWPSRVGAARRAMTQLARMSDHELQDIGLVHQDIVDAGALRLESERTSMLSGRRAARGRVDAGRRGLAA
jgi:uncharacterized protein YjiS (DUF1127 family)